MAAVLFTIPESWHLMQEPDGVYTPLVAEFLLLLFGFIGASALNFVVVIPLCLVLRRKRRGLLAGLGLSLLLAVLGSTVGFAYEIFGIKDSILHPDYFFPLFLPIFVMSLSSFYYLTTSPKVKRAAAEVPAGADASPPEQASD